MRIEKNIYYDAARQIYKVKVVSAGKIHETSAVDFNMAKAQKNRLLRLVRKEQRSNLVLFNDMADYFIATKETCRSEAGSFK